MSHYNAFSRSLICTFLTFSFLRRFIPEKNFSKPWDPPISVEAVKLWRIHCFMVSSNLLSGQEQKLFIFFEECLLDVDHVMAWLSPFLKSPGGFVQQNQVKLHFVSLPNCDRLSPKSLSCSPVLYHGVESLFGKLWHFLSTAIIYYCFCKLFFYFLCCQNQNKQGTSFWVYILLLKFHCNYCFMCVFQCVGYVGEGGVGCLSV